MVFSNSGLQFIMPKIIGKGKGWVPSHALGVNNCYDPKHINKHDFVFTVIPYPYVIFRYW